MATTPPKSSGIAQADELMLKALDMGLQFPPTVSRWHVLAWAAEELELRRNNPTDFDRGGFRRVWDAWFGPTATRLGRPGA